MSVMIITEMSLDLSLAVHESTHALSDQMDFLFDPQVATAIAVESTECATCEVTVAARSDMRNM